MNNESKKDTLKSCDEYDDQDFKLKRIRKDHLHLPDFSINITHNKSASFANTSSKMSEILFLVHSSEETKTS